MAHDGSITTLLNRLSAGDADAASPLWDRYFQRMVALAVGRLPGLTADAEDVALSAFFQFCRAATENRFVRLASRDDLWHLLVVLTARKAVDWRKFQTAQKRNGPTQAISEDVADRVTDPALAAVVTDEIRGLFDKLGDEDLQTIAKLKLEGHTNEEIAGRLNCTTRTVMRRLAIIRDLWEADAPALPDPANGTA